MSEELKIIAPNGMMGSYDGESGLESMLRIIAMRFANPKDWSEKYGAEVDNDVFMMKPYCWCDQEGCDWCGGDNPNFHHKPSGFKVTWYKYIGRGMEVSKNITIEEMTDILQSCLASA